MATRRLEVEIIGDSRSLERAFGKSGAATQSFGKTLLKTAAITGAAVAGYRAVSGALSGSLKAAAEAEVSQKKLQAQLRASGISYKQYGTQIDDTLKKQSQLSAFDDEELADSFTGLVRATGDVNKALELNALAADMARAKGMSLEAAAMQVTKAQMGQIGALRRVGIEIEKVTTAQDALGKGASDAAKEQAKAADLAATKQKAIALLQQKFAGQAKAYGDTAAGAQERFKVALENLGEVIGGKILPKLVPLIARVTEFINAAADSEKLAEILGRVGTAVGQLFGVVEKLATTAKSAFDWFREGSVVADGLTAALAGLTAGIIAYIAVTKTVAAVTKGWAIAQGILNAVMAANPFVLIIAGLVALGAALVVAYRHSETFRKIVDAAFAAVKAVTSSVVSWLTGTAVPAFKAAWDKMASFVQAAVNVIRPFVNAIIQVIRGFVDIVVGIFTGDWARAWNGLKTAALGGWNLFKAWATTLPAKMLGWASDIGAALVSGIKSGIANGWDAFMSWLDTQIQKIPKFIRNFFGIDSPSRLMAEQVGVPLGQGILVGMNKSLSSLPEAMRDKITAGIEAGARAIESGRSRFESAFSSLTSTALEAFDKMAGDIETRSERKLRLLNEAEAKKQITEGITSARAALAEAMAGGDQEAILAAQKQLEDALLAQRRYNLERQAEEERAKLNERLALKRRHFEEELAALKSAYERGKMSAREFHQRLVNLFEEYHVPYKKGATKLGLALAEGLHDAFKDVEKAAKILANAILDQFSRIKVTVEVQLKHKNPTRGSVPGLASGGPVSAGGAYIVGEKGPELFVPHASGRIIPNMATMGRAGGGGGVTVVVNAPNYVGDKRDLAEAMQEVVGRFVRSNGGSFFPG